ncbi:MAG: hypothetical protein ACE5HW_01295 [Candidatus Methanofastidiosia archaeon]
MYLKYLFKEKKDFSFIALGIFSEFLYLGLLFLGNLREKISEFLILSSLLFLIYFLLIYRFKTSKLKLILGFALLFRLTLLFQTPTLSEDIYRYLWDGRVAGSHMNPYAYPPSSEELLSLRDENWEYINHKDVGTPYPPFSELTFFLLYLISPTIFGFKLAFILLDFGCIFLVLRILKVMSLSQARVAIYALNPLSIIEISGSGHMESLPIFFMLLSFHLYLLRREFSSTVSLALSTLSKFYSLLFLPFLLRKNLKVLIPFSLALTRLYLFFFNQNMFEGISTYLKTWRFNPSLFRILEHLFGWGIAKYTVYLIISISLFVLRREDYIKGSFTILEVYLILTPALHPWYLLWILPFLSLYESKAFLTLSFTVLFSYSFYIGMREIWWFLVLEYLPFYLLLTYELRNIRFLSLHRKK